MEATEDAEMAVPVEGRSVIKRDGSKQPIDKTKLIERLKKLSYGLSEEYITFNDVVDKVANGLYDSKCISVACSNVYL